MNKQKPERIWEITLAFGPTFLFAGLVFIYEAIKIKCDWNEFHYFVVGFAFFFIGIGVFILALYRLKEYIPSMSKQSEKHQREQTESGMEGK